MPRDPEKRRLTYERHKERAKQRALDKISPERKAETNEIARRSKYRSRYGIHHDEYLALLLEQEGLCAICKTPSERLQLDHCHATGRVRGILCFRCNNALGCVGDQQLVLAEAIAYLRKHGGLT